MKTPLDKEIAVCNELALNTPIREVANNHSLDKNTVLRIKKDHKELIEKASAQLLTESLQDIVDITTHEIKESAQLSRDLLTILKDSAVGVDKDKPFPRDRLNAINDLLKRIDKKQELILKSAGILASPTASLVYNQTIFNDNKTQVSSVVLGLIGNAMDMEAPEELIDITDEN